MPLECVQTDACRKTVNTRDSYMRMVRNIDSWQRRLQNFSSKWFPLTDKFYPSDFLALVGKASFATLQIYAL
jgi:hypothetical protein